jgi:hypothetical protein
MAEQSSGPRIAADPTRLASGGGLFDGSDQRLLIQIKAEGKLTWLDRAIPEQKVRRPHGDQPPSTRSGAFLAENKMKSWWHEQRVRERAYEIWQNAGCPDGKSVEHWLQAEAEIAADEQGLEDEIKLEREGAV